MSAKTASVPPQTFVQKALARGAGKPFARIGEVLDVKPDIMLSHDNTAAIYQHFLTLEIERVKEPSKLAITLDHAAPAPSVKHAENHTAIREFVRDQDVRHFFDVGRGICHQVLSEEAVVLPGQIILGSDSHTPHFGWMGAFGTGIGRSEMAATWALGELWLRVPETIKIELTGNFSAGVTAKDLALWIIGHWGADGGLYKAIEFCGSGLSELTIENRMTLVNMMAEFGAKSACFPPDETVYDWLAPRVARTRDISEKTAFELMRKTALYPDDGAEYEATLRVNLNQLEPVIACPHTVDNMSPISEVEGILVDQAYIGTCTNGRLSDIAAAAKILKGKRIARGTRLMIVPASSEVMERATEQGYISDLLAAGAVISPPGCGACMGNHLGVLGPGEVCISSANRNFQGRMGTREASIYLASPEVVAASAVAGYITHPAAINEGEYSHREEVTV